MREKKYANITEENTEKENDIEDVIAMLDETKELSKKSFNEEKETEEVDKLSLTREIKFKELQEQIENDEKAVTREIVLEPSKPKKTSKKETPEVSVEEPKKAKKGSRKKKETKEIVEKKESKDDDVTITKIDLKKLSEIDGVDVDKDLEKTINEDLYLTTAFKPAKKRVKKIVKKIIALIITLGIIAALIFFVLIPLYKKYNTSSKEIFTKNIDSFTNYLKSLNLSSTSLEGNVDNMSIYLETNNPNYKSINNYEIVGKIENDIDNNAITISTNVIKDGNKAGYTFYKIEDELYLNITNSENIIKFDEEIDKEISKEISKEIMDMLDGYSKSQTTQQNEITYDDAIYLIIKYFEVYKNFLNEDDITKQKEKLTVNNKDISVTRYTHELNKEQSASLDKLMYDMLINDNRCLKVLSKTYHKDGTELKEALKEDYLNNDYDENYTQKVNIYTKNIDEFVGIDIEENGFRTLYYYSNDNYFDFLIDVSKDENEKNDTDKNNDSDKKNEEDTKKIYQITKSVENDRDKIVIQHNGKEVLKLYPTTLSNTDIVTDYQINIDDNTYSGNLNMHLTNNGGAFDVMINYKEYYYHIKGEVSKTSSKKISSFDKDKIIETNFENMSQEFKILFESLEDMDIDVESLLSDIPSDNPEEEQSPNPDVNSELTEPEEPEEPEKKEEKI